MVEKLTKQEKEWRAESDAHTLMQANMIEGDTSRLKAALSQVNKMNKAKEKELKAGQKLVKAKRKNTKPKKRVAARRKKR